MKLNKIFLSGMVALASLTASAQEQKPGDKVVNEFVPHWYIQGQIGGQYTLGEIKFGHLLAPNAQLGVGYEFSPVFGLRLSANGWQSKGGWDLEANNQTYKWKYYYVAPMVDLKFNLSNLFFGYNPNRVFNLSALLGGGVNIAWHNDDAARASQAIAAATAIPANQATGYAGYDGENLQYLWDGTKVRGVGRMGLAADFRVSERVSLGLEATANVTTDHYNSKKAGNADWYFNALAGIKINLGKSNKTRVIPAPAPQERVVERVVEKVVEKPAETTGKKLVADQPEELRRDVFFTIGKTNIRPSEEGKINDISNYLKKYPKARVTITGYADAGTGTAKINTELAKKRAQVVADALTGRYGIAKDRVSVSSRGDTVQPFSANDKNRVVIAIADVTE